MDYIYQIFGSSSSKDNDIMVFVDEIKTIDENHSLIKDLNVYFEDKYPTKKANCNIAIVKDGVMVDVFKGTKDEVNNSLIDTYVYHIQEHPLQITKRVERDSWLKVLRTARVILSFYSRSELRSEIKSALRGDLNEKLKVLSQMKISELPIVNKKESKEDIYKVLAFQFGQVFGLYEEKELYTKEDIANTYNDLKPFLFREYGDLRILDYYLLRFINLCNNHKENKTLIEY